MNPKVSIIIPTYNSQAYIAQALESVLNQTYTNFEIILVDDASTDSTLEVVRSFRDERLKIISNKQNRGVSYGRNCGIKAAKGNWIALLDSDDWYAPQRLEKLIEVAQQSDADLVADDLYLVCDRESQPWSTLLHESDRQISSVMTIDAVELVVSDRPNPINAKRNWSFGYTKPLIRRQFLRDRGIEYDESIHVGEDYVLYLECLRQQARFAIVPHAYYYYRTRVISLSTRKPTEYLSDTCDVTNIFIRRELDSQTNPELLKALFENLEVYRKRLAYYRVLEAIKQKSIIKTIEQIVNNPFTLEDLFYKFVGIVQNKLSSRMQFEKSNEIGFNVASIEERS